ncbi:MAG: hypothetical protein B6I38_00885 [Anaerolineaceae bacterium 4572_5.1]|nr:MAG: hypothetical protein B5M51_09425 [Anaerolinea sp. 4484_236]OQY35948.1 MAG: hypothetical protein B6I38_00885 [Anaerolineaceae bacterium 4572_5.1]
MLFDSSNKNYIIIGVILDLILIIVGCVIVRKGVNFPDPNLQLTDIAASLAAMDPEGTPTPTLVASANQPTPTPTPMTTIRSIISITHTPNPTLEYSDKQITILLLGSDKKEPETTFFRTDLMMFVTVNKKQDTVSIVSIPRDLFVEIPGLGKNRINTAFGFGGFETLADTMQHNFGVRPDYYVLIDYWFFPGVIDNLGGIDVQVASDYCHPLLIGTGEICVSQGEEHMDGETAMWYAQTRYTTSDFDRHRRQQEILDAVFDRFIELNTLQSVPKLYSTYRENVTTNLKLGTILSMLPTAVKVRDKTRIHRYFIGPDEVIAGKTAEGWEVLFPKYEEIREIFNEALNIE